MQTTHAEALGKEQMAKLSSYIARVKKAKSKKDTKNTGFDLDYHHGPRAQMLVCDVEQSSP